MACGYLASMSRIAASMSLSLECLSHPLARLAVQRLHVVEALGRRACCRSARSCHLDDPALLRVGAHAQRLALVAEFCEHDSAASSILWLSVGQPDLAATHRPIG